MDFNAYRKQMILDNIMNTRLQTEQYERDMMRSYITNQPVQKPIKPAMPFLSSYTNPDRYAFDGLEYDYFTGSGLAEDNVLRGLLARNESVRATNRAELLGDESGTFDTPEQADTSSQKQSLELYFNELQDGGFGGTDINRENTRKALFNLKAIGLSLDLKTLQRYEKIVNEFIDSFVLSVQNPQFSEIIFSGEQNIAPSKRAEILKASLKNLDSIENVLRILKVLDMLEETYNTQDIQREPIFEARFNDIIEAKPTQYIPNELRALLTHANKTFDKIKDKMQGIQDIRANTKEDRFLKEDKAQEKVKLDNDIMKISETFAQDFNTFVTKAYDKVRRTSSSPREWKKAFGKLINPDTFDKYLQAFFTERDMREIIARIVSNENSSPAVRKAYIRLANGEGDITNNIKSASKPLADMIKTNSGRIVEEFRQKISESTVPPVAPPRPRNVPHGQPATTPPRPRQINRKMDEEQKRELKNSLTPLPKSKRKLKEKVELYDDVQSAEKQVKKFTDSLSRKKTKNSIDVATVQLENAKKVLEFALQNEKPEEVQPVPFNLDGDDGRAIPVETRSQKRKREAQEAEERAKAQALAQAQEQLERQQLAEAGEEEQKGEGRRRKAHKKKGGMKKTQTIDNEHRARLKALFK